VDIPIPESFGDDATLFGTLTGEILNTEEIFNTAKEVNVQF